MIIVGTSVLNRKDSSSILKMLSHIATHSKIYTNDWNGFNILHTAASTVGALDIGIGNTRIYQENINDIKSAVGNESFVYLLGADEIRIHKPDTHFVVYQGHHGDYGANIANVILPGAAYTEKYGTYVNLEGRVQQIKPAFHAPGNAREDWKIIRALSEVIGNKLPYNSYCDIQKKLHIIAPHLLEINKIVNSQMKFTWSDLHSSTIEYTALAPVLTNFYQTNAISRASQLMSKCASLYKLD